MKIKGEFILREVAGETLLVPVGETALKFNGMITLNRVSAVIWKALSEQASYNEILGKILGRFDVEPDAARRDLDEFLEQMKAADLLDIGE
ncbi:MAG: PqqD family protein [Lachnospiraceae bacterium]|nr:PqqD family protein [Lachnospiraceae bacterium]